MILKIDTQSDSDDSVDIEDSSDSDKRKSQQKIQATH